MMHLTFEYKWVLAFLVIPLGLIIYGWIRGAHRVALPFDHQPMQRNAWWTFLLRVSRMLPKFLLAVAILILAGPREFEQPKQERELTNIQFCIDVSGSMTAKFGDGDRYDAAMSAMNNFINQRKNDAFGLTIFGNKFLHWVPLTSDASAFKCAHPFLKPDNLPSGFGGTEIGKALKACSKILIDRKEGDRIIILCSDGDSWDLNDGNDSKIATELKSEKIKVYAIHIGEGEVPEEVQNIASMTGGASFPAGNQTGLNIIFNTIEEMSKAKLKRLTPNPVDYYFPFVIIGFSILALRLLCLFGLRYTPW